MGQPTFNYQCSVVQDLSIAREAIDIKCTTSMIAIDCNCSNQLPSVFISAGPVAIIL